MEAKKEETTWDADESPVVPETAEGSGKEMIPKEDKKGSKIQPVKQELEENIGNAKYDDSVLFFGQT